jgi:hypothetical protein
MEARAHDWPEVLSKGEILEMLDHNGGLDELSFMPRMFKHCSQRMFCPSSINLWWREIRLERASVDTVYLVVPSPQTGAYATANHVYAT